MKRTPKKLRLAAEAIRALNLTAIRGGQAITSDALECETHHPSVVLCPAVSR